LGGETSADLEIRWPSGMRQTLKGVEANQIVTIKEGTGIVMNQKSVRLKPGALNPQQEQQ